MEDILLYFSLKYKGQFDLIYKALERKERVDESLKEELFKTIKSSYTTIISDDYPQQLKYRLQRVWCSGDTCTCKRTCEE